MPLNKLSMTLGSSNHWGSLKIEILSSGMKIEKNFSTIQYVENIDFA